MLNLSLFDLDTRIWVLKGGDRLSRRLERGPLGPFFGALVAKTPSFGYFAVG